MSKSQEAFEAWFLREYGCISNGAHTHEKISFYAGASYGRNQAQEKLQAVYHRTYPSIEAQLAAIKELIK
jgi:hypothetical protein